MPVEDTKTLSPEAVDPSFEDLENYLGDSAAPPVATKPAPAPEPPAETAPKQTTSPEAAAVEETPVTEPGQTTEPEETTGEQQQEPEPEPEGKPKKKHDLNARLSALAQKRREAEAREREATRALEEERTKAERLARELEALRSGQPGPAKPATEGKPTTSDTTSVTTTDGTTFSKPKPTLKDFTQAEGKHYKDGEDYDDAVTRYDDAREQWYEEKRAFEDRKRAETDRAERIRKGFLADWKVALDEHPDFEDSSAYVRTNSPEGLQGAISSLPRFSDQRAAWPEVVVYLADNPDKLQELSDLYAENPHAAVAELGVIRHSLKPAAAPKAQQAPITPTVPKTPRVAPRPPVAVGGGSAPAPVDLETADMNTFANEVAKYL